MRTLVCLAVLALLPGPVLFHQRQPLRPGAREGVVAAVVDREPAALEVRDGTIVSLFRECEAVCSFVARSGFFTKKAIIASEASPALSLGVYIHLFLMIPNTQIPSILDYS